MPILPPFKKSVYPVPRLDRAISVKSIFYINMCVHKDILCNKAREALNFTGGHLKIEFSYKYIPESLTK